LASWRAWPAAWAWGRQFQLRIGEREIGAEKIDCGQAAHLAAESNFRPDGGQAAGESAASPSRRLLGGPPSPAGIRPGASLRGAKGCEFGAPLGRLRCTVGAWGRRASCKMPSGRAAQFAAPRHLSARTGRAWCAPPRPNEARRLTAAHNWQRTASRPPLASSHWQAPAGRGPFGRNCLRRWAPSSWLGCLLVGQLPSGTARSLARSPAGRPADRQWLAGNKRAQYRPLAQQKTGTLPTGKRTQQPRRSNNCNYNNEQRDSASATFDAAARSLIVLRRGGTLAPLGPICVGFWCAFGPLVCV